jgi:murein DD-endopeptidase MepM/ murein hydrolase activator NlpD
MNLKKSLPLVALGTLLSIGTAAANYVTKELNSFNNSIYSIFSSSSEIVSKKNNSLESIIFGEKLRISPDVLPDGSPDGAADGTHAKEGLEHKTENSMENTELCIPVGGVVGRPYGRLKDPIDGVRRPHEGIDIKAKERDSVFSAKEGKIKYAGMLGDYGNIVIISHPDHSETYYAHLRTVARNLRIGKQVGKHEYLGRVGHTGRSTGPHLHFEYRINVSEKDPDGKPVNPAIHFENYVSGVKRGDTLRYYVKLALNKTIDSVRLLNLQEPIEKMKGVPAKILNYVVESQPSSLQYLTVPLINSGTNSEEANKVYHRKIIGYMGRRR